jgi:hypothetical protein
MLSQDVNTALAACKLIVSRLALSPTYRAIEISPHMVRTFAKYASLDISVSLGLAETVVVDCNAFIAVCNSLAAQQEFVLSLEENTLVWECGSAKGRLPLMKVELPEVNTRRPRFNVSISPTPDLIKAIDLGALSCDSAALGAIGMFGVVVETFKGGCIISSTDNVSISSCFSPTELPMPIIGEVMTLPPEGMELLSSIMKPDGKLEIDGDGWYYRSTNVKCLVKYVQPLVANVSEMLNKYSEMNLTVPIPRGRIESFLKRVSALTESRRNALVGVSTSNGRLVLAFAEGLSTSDEYFLVDNLQGVPDIPEILLPALKTARALNHVTELVLNHMERGIIILYNPEVAFSYILSGRIPATT